MWAIWYGGFGMSERFSMGFYGLHFPGLKTVWRKSPFHFFLVISADPIFHWQILELFSVLHEQFIILFVFFLPDPFNGFSGTDVLCGTNAGQLKSQTACGGDIINHFGPMKRLKMFYNGFILAYYIPNEKLSWITVEMAFWKWHEVLNIVAILKMNLFSILIE